MNTMRTQKALLIVLGICTSLMLAGCGQSQEEDVTSSPPKDTSETKTTPSNNESVSVKGENEIALDLSKIRTSIPFLMPIAMMKTGDTPAVLMK